MVRNPARPAANRAARAVLVAALALVCGAGAAGAADYPAKDAGYHSYAEMVAHVKQVAAEKPAIVRVFSIGKSHQGRKLWAAEVSDNVGLDEGEPEVLFDGLHHAREHLSAEMAIHVLDLLSGQYGVGTRLGQRVTRLVDSRRTWIVFMVNPDGLEYDLGGSPYRSWRKNRQPSGSKGSGGVAAGARAVGAEGARAVGIAAGSRAVGIAAGSRAVGVAAGSRAVGTGSRAVGTDLNRNYGYEFGCCDGSSGQPGSPYYRGARAWSAPEVRAMRRFVQGREVGGRQRIRTHITFHSAGEMVLWPYGYTREGRPPDMTELDRRVFRAMGKAMATTNRYSAEQSSSLYPTDGDMIDWMYGRERIFSYTFELYPRGGGSARHYPPDEVIARETKRNRNAVLMLIARAACPYAVLGRAAARFNCGPFFDDLEINRGWVVNAAGADGAVGGRWDRGEPGGGYLQVGSAASGAAVLVTGRRGDRDVDGGSTTVRSPLFRVPDDGVAVLRLRFWMGLSPNSGPEDGFRVHLVDGGGTRLATLFGASGQGLRRLPAWKPLDVALPGGLAGQFMSIDLEAVDAGPDSTVEVGVDQVRVTGG